MPTRTCRTCGARRQMYNRFAWSCAPTKLYYCAVRDDLTDMESSCGEWSKRGIEYDLTPQRFDKAEQDIRYIMEQLLTET